MNCEIFEVFTRDFQALDQRTRPTMKPETLSGYVLTAISVVSPPVDETKIEPKQETKTVDLSMELETAVVDVVDK